MTEKERFISGYLECDGLIFKVSSLDDIRAFIEKYSKSGDEITESELDELTRKEGNTIVDDCGVSYISNPLILKFGVFIDNYKIKEGTLAISNNAFRASKNIAVLKSIYIPNSVVTIGDYSFYYNRGLSKVTMPSNLIKIGDYAFGCCANLSSITIPESLRIIGKGAFSDCCMKEIAIPASVIKIGAHAFINNDKLEKVTFKGIPGQISSGLFDNCKSLKMISVPIGSRDIFIKELFPIDESIIIEQ